MESRAGKQAADARVPSIGLLQKRDLRLRLESKDSKKMGVITIIWRNNNLSSKKQLQQKPLGKRMSCI